MKNFVNLNKLDVYNLALSLSSLAWRIYESLSWQTKKIIGDQFIQATDSVGANIAEGSGRYHYLDRIKFYYNARGSLIESRHWFDLMNQRKMIKIKQFSNDFLKTWDLLHPKLNGWISVTYKAKSSS